MKLDKFGKQKIDRTICLTTHHILIVYEGVLDLELKSKLEIKCLHFIIKSATRPNEIMMFFNNKQRSCMHVIMLGEEGEPEEFYNLLKLRWTSLNPEKRLRVFAVPGPELMQYHQTQAKYDFDTQMPPDKYRLVEEEVVPNQEYQEHIKTGKPLKEILEQDANNFEFANSRGIKNNPQDQVNASEESMSSMDFGEIKDGPEMDINKELGQELLDDIRSSRLVRANDQEVE